jgi:Carboxypeptidase regulatory-like domain/TonB-dependent Receptor Plug Domain
MFTNQTKTSKSSSMSKWFRRIPWLVIPVMLLSFSIANAQQLTGTLSGITADQTDARVPGAKVVVTNESTGDVRETKSDAQGFFSVTALIPGTYKVTISAKSFATWEENGILINQGDSRTIPNIHLKIGSEATAVTVISGADAEIPVDTAEVSATLNNELVDSATLTGRNASELIKMMPGVTFSGNTSSYNSQVTGTNNGPAGSFSANGTQPYGSTDVYLDGANLIDPGNAGTQVANINQDMTDSVKYLSASYGAEYAKGPAVLQAFSKSGGQKFHGEAYLYARNTAVGYANDWYNNATGNKLQPQSFYYVGGNVGGPVFFPHFNHNRDKLFFWAGYEYMDQHPYNAPVEMNVPTADQIKGDYRNIGIDPNVIKTYGPTYTLPCSNAGAWDEGCSDKTISPWNVPGQDFSNLSAYYDPNGKIISGLNPAANQTPNGTNGWNNYGYSPNTPQNRWEVTGKVTYAFNDNNKLWGSYTLQQETDSHPLSIWWAPTWTIPYPSLPVGKETAHVYLANFTHVFSATTTNEVVFAYSEFVNNNSLSNVSASSRKTLGLPAQSLFGTPKTDQIPNSTGGWNSGLTEINEFDFNSGIYGPGTFGKTSKAPSIADTFTKIIRTHSVKAGFYWDAQENLQANGSPINGNYDFENWGYTTTQNMTLDRLMGRVENYSENNTDVVPDIIWHQWSLWAQDSWKASRKLTLNIGLRADHMGQWYDKIGGTQVWDPASYDNSSKPPANTGLLWHDINSKIPTSGWKSQLFLWNPRLGFAYDVMGTGKTVVRAGFGTYRYQVSSNDASGAMNGPLGSFGYGSSNVGVNGFYGYNIQGGLLCMHPDPGGLAGSCSGPTAKTQQLPVPQGLNQNGADIHVDQQGDDKVPYADTYSLGVAQALPGHTVMEISYVGSASRNQLLNGANGHIEDANTVPYGAFFTPDPKTGTYWNTSPIGANCVSPCTAANVNDWRPLNNYGHVFIQTHGGYANYNSLQVSAQKQSGNLYMFTNFTFGKVLGTRDGSTSNGNGNGSVINPFNLDANYGPLGYDHTKVFNLSFSYKLPKPIHNNMILGAVVNGWQISNYTTYQDGANYQANSPNMNAAYQQYQCKGPTDPYPGCTGQSAGATTTQPTIITMPMPATAVGGNTTESIGNNTWYGSNQYENGLQPVVVCDPRKHLLKGQYFNPNCFAAPLPPTSTSFGQVGQTIWPYIRTPHYFGSDLAVFKAFRVTDSQRVEIRISATNFLNHPNAQFGIGGNSDNQLVFNGVSTGQSLVYNSQAATTGIPQNKQGYRWMQFAAKYYF